MRALGGRSIYWPHELPILLDTACGDFLDPCSFLKFFFSMFDMDLSSKPRALVWVNIWDGLSTDDIPAKLAPRELQSMLLVDQKDMDAIRV